jgi:hypothetical protein
MSARSLVTTAHCQPVRTACLSAADRYFKHHRLPNFCAKDLAQLSTFGRKALRNMRRRPKLIAAFWKQAELW